MSSPLRFRQRRICLWRAARAGSAAARAATWTRRWTARPSCPGPACGSACPAAGSHPRRLPTYNVSTSRGSRGAVHTPQSGTASSQRYKWDIIPRDKQSVPWCRTFNYEINDQLPDSDLSVWWWHLLQVYYLSPAMWSQFHKQFNGW